MTGMMLPRRLTSPATEGGRFGARVIAGVWVISRTLKTLIPKTSSVPRENSRSSIMLEPASLVRASTLSSTLALARACKR